MLRLSKVRFNRAIEGSGVTTDKNPPIDPQTSSRDAQNGFGRTSKFLVTAVIVALGIAAGWVGGRVLNSRTAPSTAAMPSTDVPDGDNPAPAAHAPAEPGSQPAKHAETPDKPVTPEQPAAEGEQSVVESESRPKEAELKKAPPEVPRVDKEEEADKPSADPSKEIGRKALKEMDNKNANGRASGNRNGRFWGNKNGNEERY